MNTIQPVNSEHLRLANQVASFFASLPQVKAITMGGSRRNASSPNGVDIESFSDLSSDIDLYVYTKDIIPLATRVEIVKRSGGASETSLDLNFWGLGDEWYNFTLNRQLHPGEKRLVEKAASLCEKIPENMQADLTKVMESAAGELQDLSFQLECLLDRLQELLDSEAFLFNP
jgi:hypothetical protein